MAAAARDSSPAAFSSGSYLSRPALPAESSRRRTRNRSTRRFYGQASSPEGQLRHLPLQQHIARAFADCFEDLQGCRGRGRPPAGSLLIRVFTGLGTATSSAAAIQRPSPCFLICLIDLRAHAVPAARPHRCARHGSSWVPPVRVRRRAAFGEYLQLPSAQLVAVHSFMFGIFSWRVQGPARSTTSPASSGPGVPSLVFHIEYKQAVETPLR